MKKKTSLLLSICFLLFSCNEANNNFQQLETTQLQKEQLENPNQYDILLEVKTDPIEQNIDKNLSIGYTVTMESVKKQLDRVALSTQEKQALQSNMINFQEKLTKNIQQAGENSHDPQAMRILSKQLDEGSEQYKQAMLSLGKSLMTQEEH